MLFFLLLADLQFKISSSVDWFNIFALIFNMEQLNVIKDSNIHSNILEFMNKSKIN